MAHSLAVSVSKASILSAVIDTRVSTLEQGEHGYGLRGQLKDCRRLAEELGATIVREYEDRDSGASWTLPPAGGPSATP